MRGPVAATVEVGSKDSFISIHVKPALEADFLEEFDHVAGADDDVFAGWKFLDGGT